MEKEETPFGTFTPEPKGRGTWGLLFSCSVTFGFCVWTVVHPNVPQGNSPWYRFCYRVALMVVSIIAPAGVMVCAFDEWHQARMLHTEWKKLFPKRKKLISERARKVISRLNPFGKPVEDADHLGIDVAFFIVMGGFVIDRPTGTRAPIISADHPATLTPAGFLKYVKEGRIDKNTFDKVAIRAKSKANNIAKLFSSFQALWLFSSCVARWNAHLPLSLLEIHVVIQVVCTLFIVGFWWNKPLDVNEPLTITLGLARTPTDDDLALAPELRNNPRPSRNEPFIIKHPSGTISAFYQAYYDILVNLVDNTNDAPTTVDHDTDDAKRTASPDDCRLHLIKVGVAPTTAGSINVLRSLVGLFFLVGVGILHAAAWHVKCPTTIERTLWRVSSVGMCIIPVCLAAIAKLGGYHEDLLDAMWDFQKAESVLWLIYATFKKAVSLAEKNSQWKRDRNRWRYYFHFVSIWLFISLIGGYNLCILFITVESYISLRSPPDGTFLTPRWSDYWPHM